jgi:uncharacterized protein with NRDE domain
MCTLILLNRPDHEWPMLIAANRDERNDDMAELIRYVNAQREDDQVFFANQVQQLSEDLLQQSGYPLYSPTND